MRLHLIIQRNGLPTTQILWTVPQLAQPPNTTKSIPPQRSTSFSSSSTDTHTTVATVPLSANPSGASLTIAQLLEQVNEVIPLESEDWGLDDYAVEVAGFECLHFAEVGGLGGVLRDGDVVCIRPLQTSDLRVRKFSGRHQISSDGKHLIDGVAFGRGFLKRNSGRPAVRIESRKRRRVLADDDEGESGGEVSFGIAENGIGQVVVRAGFEDADDEDEEEDEDGNFDPEQGLEDEVDDLQELLRLDEEGFHNFAHQTRRRWTRAGLGLNFLTGGGYSNPLLDQYSQDEPSPGSSVLTVQNRRERSKSDRPNSVLTSQRVTRAVSSGSNKSVRFEEQGEVATPATEIAVDDDDDDDDDEDFNPEDDEDSTDVDESDKENTEPLEDIIAINHTSDSSASSDIDTSDDELEDEDETSSSGTSSLESDSDSEPDTSKPITSVRKSTIVNGRSSSSSSTSEGNANSKGGKANVTSKPAVSGKPKPGKPTEDAKKEPAAQPQAPPRSGRRNTQSRNMRRKVSESLKFHKATGELPEDATAEDLIRFKEQSSSGLPPWARKMRVILDAQSTEVVDDEPEIFEEEQQDASPIKAKKQELLDSLESAERIEVAPSFDLNDAVVPAVNNQPDDEVERAKVKKKKKKTKSAKKVTGSSQKEPTSIQPETGETKGGVVSQLVEDNSGPATVQVPGSLPETQLSSTTQLAEVSPLDAPTISLTPPNPSASPGSVPSGSQRPRVKLDLASSKRLLFGSLGLKAPKNRDDELALREKLMKDVKPIKPVKERVAEIEAAQANSEPPETDDDSWREKIRVAAVECCHEGIQYSAPPFPFVQRWDPQQQGTLSKGKGKERRKRKRQERRRLEEMCQESYKSTLEPESPSKISRQESYEANTEQPQFDAEAFKKDFAQHSQEWSHQQKLDDSAAANEQLLRESSECGAYEVAHREQDLEIEELRNLPTLSDDLTTYPELTKEQCSVGAVIAFKRFLMSAETNWQPGISGYLTAVVREFYENGTLLMTLAKRDQPNDEARYDEETGERLYAKFEMPGYDDEIARSDRSQLEMPFDELISPRLIRAAPNKDHNGINDNRVSTASDPGDTLVGDEAQRAGTEPQAVASFDSSMNHPPHSKAGTSGPFESAPQDITDVEPDSHLESSQAAHRDEDLHINGNSTSFQSDDQSPGFNAHGSSPVNGQDSASSPVRSDAEEEFQTRHLSKEGPGILDATEEPSVLSSHTAVVEYPTLPQSHEESESVHNQRQHRSVSLNSEVRANSPYFVSPPPTRREKGSSKLSPTPISQSQKLHVTDAKPISTLDGANDSSDDLPELFSQAFEARMSQDPVLKDESVPHSSLHNLPKASSKAASFEMTISENALPKNTQIGLEEGKDADIDSSYRPSQSELLQSSQIVDLTMSSDPADPRYNETGNMSSYQSSGGWVDKSNASLDLPVGKRSSKRKTKSRATRAY